MSIQHKKLHANRHAKNKIEMFTTPNKNDSLNNKYMLQEY